MLSSDWLIKGAFFFYQFLVFFHFIPIAGVFVLGNSALGKYHAWRKIPSLNNLWSHRCNFELLGFLLSTNAKVKKNDRRQCQSICLKSLKCIYFKFICIIFFTCCISSKTVIYSIFDFAPEIHIFEKIFPVFLDL
jgi:hypothetical protein